MDIIMWVKVPCNGAHNVGTWYVRQRVLLLLIIMSHLKIIIIEMLDVKLIF